MTTVHTATRHCPTWCCRHEESDNLCIDPRVDLNFGPSAPGQPLTIHHAAVLAYNDSFGGPVLTLVFNNGTDSGDMTPAQARQIGAALIQAADNAAIDDSRQGAPYLTLLLGGAR